MARRRRTFWMQITPSPPQEETLEVMRPYPGTRDTLRAVCEHGGKNYLYSHRDHASIDALEHYGLKPYFSDFITKDDHFPRKPAPDALLHMISKHGRNPQGGDGGRSCVGRAGRAECRNAGGAV